MNNNNSLIVNCLPNESLHGSKRWRGLVLALVLTTALLALDACGSSTPALSNYPSCIRPGMREIRIRWGDWIDSTAVLTGHEIDAQGKLFAYQASPYSVKYLRDSVSHIDTAQVCYWVDTVRKTFLRIQSLTVHAPHMRYVEYQNPDAHLSLRAVWDSRFETYGSKEFRAIFDSLQTLVPPPPKQ